MSGRIRQRGAGVVVAALAASLVVAFTPRGGEAAQVNEPVTGPKDGPAAASAQGMGTPNCGKATIRKANGDAWKCVFSDDFNGTKLNTSKWKIIKSSESNFGPRNDCYVNSRYNLAVNSGVLKLVTRRNLRSFTCGSGKNQFRTNATAALVSTFGKFHQARGRFQVRAKFPYTKFKGLQSALYMFPEGGALGAYTSGEIDFAEWYSRYPNQVIPYLHYNLGIIPGSQVTNVQCVVRRVDNWHIYTLEWTSKHIIIRYDGVQCLKNTSGVLLAQFTRASFLNLMMSQGLGRHNAPDLLTPLRGEMQVDWVRVWR
jgi:beta-glucanase (GH16 family)